MNTHLGKHTDDLRPVQIQMGAIPCWNYLGEPLVPPDSPLDPIRGHTFPITGRYLHRKGGIYRVQSGAVAGPHTCVAYTDHAGQWWVRPVEQWAERFTLLRAEW